MTPTHRNGRRGPTILGATERLAAPGTSSPGRTSRRRPPREQVITYRITIDLDGAVPRIWREIEIASDLRLDKVHDVLQVAMGWTDSHLHAFAVGDSWRDPRTERFAMAGDFQIGFEGDAVEVPEAEVRLDELLQDVGDILLYTYDFGDGWDHTVRLDEALPRPDLAAPARCTAGGGKCPPEDCGGLPGYDDLLADAADLDRVDPRDRDEFVERLGWLFPGVAPATIAAAAETFDLARANAELAKPPPPGPLLDLLDRTHGPGREVLADLIDRARLDRPILIDADVATRMVEPFAWLVEYVGVAGLPLTGAGYLKPTDVAAVVEALGFASEWTA